MYIFKQGNSEGFSLKRTRAIDSRFQGQVTIDFRGGKFPEFNPGMIQVCPDFVIARPVNTHSRVKVRGFPRTGAQLCGCTFDRTGLTHGFAFANGNLVGTDNDRTCIRGRQGSGFAVCQAGTAANKANEGDPARIFSTDWSKPVSAGHYVTVTAFL
jgi:hypothetical protein